MLFGTAIYKVNKLHAEHQLTSVNMRLNRAKTAVKNAQKTATSQKNALYNAELANKEAFIAARMQGAQDGGEATSQDQQIDWEARSEALADWNKHIAQVKECLDNEYEESSNDLVQAAMQEEEDLTIESSYWQEMRDYWSEMIKQAESWFKESLQAIFGGGHGH